KSLPPKRGRYFPDGSDADELPAVWLTTTDPNAHDSPTLTFNNVLLSETKEAAPVVFLPRYGPEALDKAAAAGHPFLDEY
ncbi:hypothetical protein N9Z85_07060, partial [Akkermansiaceae bacterium]|nr:hypothetical protein [Akkermansiaceae bacterium]